MAGMALGSLREMGSPQAAFLVLSGMVEELRAGSEGTLADNRWAKMIPLFREIRESHTNRRGLGDVIRLEALCYRHMGQYDDFVRCVVDAMASDMASLRNTCASVGMEEAEAGRRSEEYLLAMVRREIDRLAEENDPMTVMFLADAVVARYPGTEAAHYGYAALLKALYGQGNKAAAAEIGDRWRAECPECALFPEAVDVYCAALSGLGRHREAWETWLAASRSATDRERKAHGLLMAGSAMRNGGRDAAAIRTFRSLDTEEFQGTKAAAVAKEAIRIMLRAKALAVPAG